jgi:hypothetical protein
VKRGVARSGRDQDVHYNVLQMDRVAHLTHALLATGNYFPSDFRSCKCKSQATARDENVSFRLVSLDSFAGQQ